MEGGVSLPHGCKHPAWGTPSAAALLRPGNGFRVVTEQPIRGVARARGLLPANTALRSELAPKSAGNHKGKLPVLPSPGWKVAGEAWHGARVIPGGITSRFQAAGEQVWRCFGGHGAFLQNPCSEGSPGYPENFSCSPPKGEGGLMALFSQPQHHISTTNPIRRETMTVTRSLSTSPSRR